VTQAGFDSLTLDGLMSKPDGFLALFADWIEGWTEWSFRGDEYIAPRHLQR
jgi:hypothetical protein